MLAKPINNKLLKGYAAQVLTSLFTHYISTEDMNQELQAEDEMKFQQKVQKQQAENLKQSN